MKRRLTVWLLCAALLSSGCMYYDATAQNEEACYHLYFLETDLDASGGGDALQATPLALEEELDTQALAERLLTALLAGPPMGTLHSTIPAGTTLQSVTVENDQALVDLSASYGALSGVALTLADYAITLTLTQLPDISSVTITVQGQELAYRERQTFTEGDVLLSSQEDVVGTVQAELYFPDGAGALIPQSRTLDLYEGDTQVEAVTRALAEGAANKMLSDGVKAVWLEDAICYVNLSSASLEENTALSVTMQALRQSLLSLDTVEEVHFLVDGEFMQYEG